MKLHYFYSTFLPYLLFNLFTLADSKEDIEEKAKKYMQMLNEISQKKANIGAHLNWAYVTDLTEGNGKKLLKARLDGQKSSKEYWSKTINIPWKTFKDPVLRREFSFYSSLGESALPDEDYKERAQIISQMQEIYSKAKVCEYRNKRNCTLSLDPELTDIFTTSRDPDELKYYWIEWRKASGKKCRTVFEKYVDLSNKAARLNNFTDTSEVWLDEFASDLEDDDDDNMRNISEKVHEFEETLYDLWNHVKPFYMELHAYVRRRLREKYGENVVPESGAIPAHLLGNMWAQSWENIYDITVPFPGKESTDVTSALKKQGYTVLKMVKLAEQFYKSIDLSPMPESFWKNSLFEKPKNRNIVCHPSAWDFADGKDFRMKLCASVNHYYLDVLHHEMGHIEYYIQYKDQPYFFREGANSGFHEAVGDTISLSVRTPSHLRKIGLLDANTEDDEESDINSLYLSALKTITFLPFGYLIDLWRWSVFRGEITPANYNCNWWNLRWNLQGLEPPVDRSEADFDPAAKFHVVANVPYIRYFVSHLLQFQFHRSLCEKAGLFNSSDPTSKPLHQCDIYQSKKAGDAFKGMLSLGRSKPWPEVLKVLTGQRDLDISAILQYYDPLYKWLIEDNRRHGEEIGWQLEPVRRKWCSEQGILTWIENSKRFFHQVTSKLLKFPSVLVKETRKKFQNIIAYFYFDRISQK